MKFSAMRVMRAFACLAVLVALPLQAALPET